MSRVEIGVDASRSYSLADGASSKKHAHGASAQRPTSSPQRARSRAILLGTATADEGQSKALVMDDDLLKLSLTNLSSTWCSEGCSATDPTFGSVDWVIYGPLP